MSRGRGKARHNHVQVAQVRPTEFVCLKTNHPQRMKEPKGQTDYEIWSVQHDSEAVAKYTVQTYLKRVVLIRAKCGNIDCVTCRGTDYDVK